MTRKDWLLVFLAGRQNPPTGGALDPIRIMKGMFLLCKTLKWSGLPPYTFEPYKFGPCSFAIYDDLDALEREGRIISRPVSWGHWKEYELTMSGLTAARQLHPAIPGDVLDFLGNLREWVAKVSFNALLRKVYGSYPEYATRSVLPHLGGGE